MILAYVGTYTNGNSKGIYTFRLDEETGRLQPIGSPVGLTNPSYLTADKTNEYLYAVIETEEFGGEYGGAVASFSIDKKTGELAFINCQSTMGKHPCHLILDGSSRYLFAANYTEGTFTEFPVNPDGSLGCPMAVITHKGSGPNKERQEKSHVHFVQFTPDEKHLCAVDLGVDKVMVYDFDSSIGSLKFNENLTIDMRPGSGPRHLVFHPNGKYVYIVTELGSEVAAYEYDSIRLKFKEIQYISTLPEGYKGVNFCAAVCIDNEGKFLYASNRGHDSIAVFKIQNSGKLEIITQIPSGGSFPRDFTIDPTGGYAFAANQESNNIVPFIVNKADGTMKQEHEAISIGNPVCIKFINL